jgi:large subunit ribosomal protein L19e
LNLRNKRRLAADVLGVGSDRIRFDPEAEDFIQDAITRSTIRGLVGLGAIKVAPEKGVSRGRARAKKAKGKIRHQGSFRGAKTSRHSKKEAWVTKVRALRWRLSVARDRNELTKTGYRKLYRQIKGGQVRDVKRLLEMIKESKSAK